MSAVGTVGAIVAIVGLLVKLGSAVVFPRRVPETLEALKLAREAGASPTSQLILYREAVHALALRDRLGALPPIWNLSLAAGFCLVSGSLCATAAAASPPSSVEADVLLEVGGYFRIAGYTTLGVGGGVALSFLSVLIREWWFRRKIRKLAATVASEREHLAELRERFSAREAAIDGLETHLSELEQQKCEYDASGDHDSSGEHSLQSVQSFIEKTRMTDLPEHREALEKHRAEEADINAHLARLLGSMKKLEKHLDWEQRSLEWEMENGGLDERAQSPQLLLELARLAKKAPPAPDESTTPNPEAPPLAQETAPEASESPSEPTPSNP